MTPQEMNIRVGERIGIIRRRLKISQTELGKKIGYSLNGIAKIERGESDPSLSTILRLAQALNADHNFILTGHETSRSIGDMDPLELNRIIGSLESELEKRG